MSEYALDMTIGDDNLPITVEFDYFAGEPEMVTGRAEDCHPAGGATIDITDIKVTVFRNGAARSHSMLEIPEDSWIKHIEQKCLDYIAETGE